MIDPKIKADIIAMFLAGNETGVVLATYPTIGKSSIYRMRDIAKEISDKQAIDTGKLQQPIGVIADTHIPFEHPRYLEFCRDTFSAYGVDDIVHIGDLIDNHAISFHEKNPDGYSPGDEFEEALYHARAWYDEFPRVTWISGNHDNLPKRRIMAAGLPKRILRENIYDTPEGWINREAVIMRDVRFSHGIGMAGVNGHRNLAIHKGMSCVMGHCHSFGGVSWIANEFMLKYGLNVGCGLDIESYAMAYGRDFPHRPTLGCGIVYSSELAHFVPMDMRRYSRHGK